MLSRHAFEWVEQLDAFFRLPLARNVIYLHLLCAGAAYSQRASSSFGPMSDISFGYTPVGFAWLRSSERIVVISQENPAAYFYSFDTSGAIVQTSLLNLPGNVTDIVAEPHGVESTDECALLLNDGKRVLVMRQSNDSLAETTLDLSTRSQDIAYGDINSDRRDDLLLFGKKRAGITTLLRQKNGTYIGGDLLFPDLSVSSLACLDLNGDGITDIFIVNWLSNQLELFYGIGRGVFSEQVDVTLSGEPEKIAISPLTEERTIQIAVSIPDDNLVSVFRFNAIGEIESTGSLRLPFSPIQVHFADINGDKDPDLVVTTSRAAYVFLGKGGLQFGRATTFGSGNDIRSCEEEDVDGDGKRDLLLLDRATRRLSAFGNSDWSGRIHWPSAYATGLSPQGVSIMDVNDDGMPDIVVANSGSSTLSVFLSRGGGMFEGQRTIPVSEKPVAVVQATPPLRRNHTLLSSHASTDRIDVVRFADDFGRCEVAAIPTGPEPHIVLSRRDAVSGHLEMMVRNTDRLDGSRSLSLFQQISGGQLLERSLRASLPGRITALTVGDFSGSGRDELVFVTYDRVAHQSTLSIAVPDKEFEFRAARSVMSFPDTTGSVHSILWGYLDRDDNKDLVLVMGHPRNALGIVYGRGGGVFKDSLQFIHDVFPLDGDDLVLKDVNGDGNTDLTWIDTERRAVVTAFGRGNRMFDHPVSIYPAAHVTSIQIAGIKVGRIQDLVLLNGPKGCVSVVFEPFRR